MAEENLALHKIIGFNGKLLGGAVAHPDGQHVVYAVGGSLVMRALDKDSEQLLLNRGNQAADEVCCFTVSPTGRLAASAHKAAHGASRADIVIWELATQRVMSTLSLHVGSVAALSFSSDEIYLASLGADDNRVAVWDAESGRPVCGAPASREREGRTRTLAWVPGKLSFITAGEGTMRVWELDEQTKRIEPHEVAMGICVKRVVTCVCVAPAGDVAYCGSTTGDVLLVDVPHRVFKNSGPFTRKDVPIIEQGVLSVVIAGESLIVGSGSGFVYKVDPQAWTIRKKVQLDGSGTSMSAVSAGGFLCGTALNKLYYLDKDLNSQLLLSAPYSSSVNDIAFPKDYNELFVSCSANTISVWNSHTTEELLHIEDPNKSLVCHCVAVPADGKCILSGWSDGRIRAYTPETGKFLYMMENVHHGPVTDICIADGYGFIVTGGTDGLVRIWRVGKESRVMEASMKEHKAGVTSLMLSKDCTRCISGSSDGTVLLWDLSRRVSIKSFFGSAAVMSAAFTPSEESIIAVGSEKKVIVYDIKTGTREQDYFGGQLAVTSISMLPMGSFATGSQDLAVKIWTKEGKLIAVGNGHSGPVTKVLFAPDGSLLVSAGDNGAIYTWRIL